MRHRYLLFTALLSLFAAACTDNPPDPVQPDLTSALNLTPSVSVDPDTVPFRHKDDTRWGAQSTEALWEHISEHDQAVLVGLKAPGAPRGIWRGTLLVDAPTQAEGRTAIEAIPDLEIIEITSDRPLVEVLVGSELALEQLRRLPFVDYVEPAVTEVDFFGGCDWSDVNPNWYPTAFWGDAMPAVWTRGDIQVDRAWNRSDGRGVTVGVPDTGVHPDQALLRARFNEGPTSGTRYPAPSRWVHHTYTKGDAEYGGCSHGTRISGLITAPMNNYNSTGLAFRSNLVSVRMQDEVYNFFRVSRIRTAIQISGEVPGDSPDYGRRILTFAWGSNDYEAIKDEIETQYHARGNLLVGASGQNTYVTGTVFPASHPDVIAVSAVKPDYSRHSGFNYGSRVELAFIYDSNTQSHQLSPGRNPDLTSIVGRSSSAAAAISGIAALVWSHYPNASRDWVRTRLHWAAHATGSGSHTYGHGVVNAMKAVGGMYALQIDAPFWVDPYHTFTVTANPQGGGGPFTYQWSNGATTQSTTYTAGPDGTTVNYSVSVTDTSDGTTRTQGGTSYVQDRSSCTDPTQIEC